MVKQGANRLGRFVYLAIGNQAYRLRGVELAPGAIAAAGNNRFGRDSGRLAAIEWTDELADESVSGRAGEPDLVG